MTLLFWLMALATFVALALTVVMTGACQDIVRELREERARRMAAEAGAFRSVEIDLSEWGTR